jgi:hypothetical protein
MMTYSAGERVRGIGLRRRRQPQQGLYHVLHLRLVRAPVSDDRLLNLCGCVLMDGERLGQQGAQGSAACLSEF